VSDELVLPDWPAPGRVRAFATTRLSEPADLPLAQWRVRPAIDALLPSHLPMPRLQQVHGTAVVDAERADDGVEADALVARAPGVACRVVTADCLPLLVCDRAGSEIAAIHAGWRGLAAGIVEAALGRMQARPAELLVWIGPAICQTHYEIGPEVREAFLAHGSADLQARSDACFAPRGDKYLADLAGLARVRLAALGVGAVFGGDRCTWAEPSLFPSYRRDGASTGRLSSIIFIAD